MRLVTLLGLLAAAARPAHGASTQVPVVADTWLETFPAGSQRMLIVGYHEGFPIKRTAIQAATPTVDGQIDKCTLRLGFWYAHQASGQQETWIDRVLQVYVLNVPFAEYEATMAVRSANVPWSSQTQDWITDAAVVDPDPVAQTLLRADTPTGTWIDFDVTTTCRQWASGARRNFGVIIKADNEAKPGRDLRFYSRESTTMPPYLAVDWTGQQPDLPPTVTCQAYGDPHYKTWDNIYYDFQGDCEYVLAQDCTDAARFRVEVRNRGNTRVTQTAAVAIRARGAGRVELYRQGFIPAVALVNGQPIYTLPYVDAAAGLSIVSSAGGVLVTLDTVGVSVWWSRTSMVRVTAKSEAYYKQLCGLCGDFNQDGQDETDTAALMGAHTVDPATALLSVSDGYKCGQTDPDAPSPCDNNADLKDQAAAHCDRLLELYAQCGKVVNLDLYWSSCLFDFCETGAPGACDSFIQAEEACRNAGVVVPTVLDECNVCFGDGMTCDSTCSAFGDPHYITLDSVRYDWQGQCEYVLVRDVRSFTRDFFEVQVRNSKWLPGRSVSVTEALAVRVPGQGVFNLYRALGQSTFNGAPLANLPMTLGDGTTVTSDPLHPARITIDIPGTATVRWLGTSATVRMSGRYRNRVNGLCGNYNGVGGDDLTSTGVMAHSWWKISAQIPSLFADSTAATCQDREVPTGHPCDADKDQALAALEFCERLRSPTGPYAQCHRLVSPQDVFDACRLDFCGMGDSSACGAFRTYERLCREAAARLGLPTPTFNSIIDSCDVCDGDDTSCGQTCTASGDPHWRTFTAYLHHFQGQCEYLLAGDCRTGDKVPDGAFAVHVRNTKWLSPAHQASLVQAVAIRLPSATGAEVLELFRDPAKNVLNGQPLPSTPFMVAGARVERPSANPAELRVTIPHVGVVHWSGHSMVTVTLAPAFRAGTCGLCGHWDANTNDAGFVTMNDHWSASVLGALFTVDRDEQCKDADPGQTAHPCGQDLAAWSAARDYCRPLVDPNGPYAECHAFVKPQSFFDDCIFDHCGGDGACDAFKLYEQRCRAFGVRFRSVVDNCGVCFGNGLSCGAKTCSAFGDVHYLTFAGYRYDMQGVCEYMLVGPCDNSRMPSVHVRNEPWGTRPVSVTQAVAISVPGLGVFELFRDVAANRFNGNPLGVLPLVFPNGVTVVNTVPARPADITVSIPGWGRVHWDGGYNVEVTLEAGMFAQGVCGLCGSGVSATADQDVVPRLDYWHVDDRDITPIFTDSLSAECNAVPPDPVECTEAELQEAREYCRVLQNTTLYGEHASQAAYADCVLDVCNGVDGCAVIKQFEARLTAQGLTFTSVVDECGECFGSGLSCGAMCSASGDPHYHTFSGYWHHWQGQCFYVLARECRAPSADDMFEVQVWNTKWLPNTQVSVTQAVAVRIPGLGVLQLFRQVASNLLNGNAMPPLPYTHAATGTTIVANPVRPAEIVVTIPGHGIVSWNGHSAVSVRVPRRYMNRMCGLCGVYDGNPQTDATAVQHLPSGDYWHVDGTAIASLFNQPPFDPECKDDTSIIVPHPCGAQDNDPRWEAARAYCADLLDEAGPYARCHRFVRPQQYYENCIFDHCGGQASCDAYTEYERACRAAGVGHLDSIIDPCGVCHGDGSTCTGTCTASGDPHYMTFDSRMLHFQGQCEYSLVRERGGTPRFEVQVRNTDWLSATAQVSVTEAVAIRIPLVGRVELHRAFAANRINGLPMANSFPMTLAGGVVITRPVASRPSYLVVDVPRIGQVLFDGSSYVKVTLLGTWRDRVEGLCADWNGAADNDPAVHMDNSHWLAGQTGIPSLFETPKPCRDPSPGTNEPCTTVEQKEAAHKYCAVLNPQNSVSPYADHFGTLDPTPFFEACVFDHCGGQGACDLIRQYEERLRALGLRFESMIDQCGVCFGDSTTCGSQCTGSGDPHYTTFDGRRYDWQGQCEYMVVRSRIEPNFEVHVRNTAWLPNRAVSVTQALAIKTPVWCPPNARCRPSGVIVLTRSLGDNRVNGQPFVAPVTVNGNVEIFNHIPTRPTALTVRIPHVGVVEWDGYSRFSVQLAPRFHRTTTGLCADYDSDASNDHAVYPLNGYWLVDGTTVQPLFPDSSAGQCQDRPVDPVHPCDQVSDTERQAAEAYCATLLNDKGYAECRRILSPKPFYLNCLLDQCALGNGCDAIKDYEDECRHLGANIVSNVDACGVCGGDGVSCGPVCSASGDPHWRTFKSFWHHWQGQCTYVLTRDCSRGASGFEVHVRNTAWPASGVQVSVVQDIAVRIPGGTVVELFRQGQHLIDGQPLTLPHADPNGVFTVTGSGSNVQVTIPGYAIVTFTGYSVSVQVGPRLKARLCGLCGQYDDAPASDDAAHVALQDHWYVDGTNIQALFSGDELQLCRNTVPDPVKPCEATQTALPAAQQYCSALLDRAGPYAVCHPFVDPRQYYQNCLFDHCADIEPCQSYTEYEAACARAGVTNMGTIKDGCGVCHGDGSSCSNTCIAWGDPHFSTLAGHYYSFQGQCIYSLVRRRTNKGCVPRAGEDVFEVQVKHTQWLPNRPVSVVQAVAVNVPGVGVFNLYRDVAANTFNGLPLPPLPATFGPVIVERDPAGPAAVRLRVPGEGTVFWDGVHRARVDLQKHWQSQTCGLCGLNSGDATQDVQHVPLYGYWKVSGDIRPLFPDRDAVLCQDVGDPDPDVCQGDDELQAAMEYCQPIIDPQGPYAGCQDLVDTRQLYRACLLDHCGGQGACSAFKTLEERCTAQGGEFNSIIDACGECFGDGLGCGAQCTITGDPHYHTFSGLWHHFQGGCWYRMAADCSADTDENRFEVQGQNQRIPNTAVSVLQAVAIRIVGLGRVELYRNPANNLVNGASLTLPFLHVASGTVITADAAQPNVITVKIRNYGVVVFTGYGATIRVSARFKELMCGLCGEYDGSTQTDVVAVTNPPANDYWKVDNQVIPALFSNWDGSCDDGTGGGDPPHPCGNDPAAAPWEEARDYCQPLRDPTSVYGRCFRIVNPEQFYDNCVFDHCGGTNACDSFAEYETACRRAGVVLAGSVIDECGICFGNGETCSAECMAFGDPHFTVFDQTYYSFQGQCYYSLVRPADAVVRPQLDSLFAARGFEVQVKHSKWVGAAQVSTVEEVAVRLPDGNLLHLTRTQNSLNGAPLVNLPLTLASGVVLQAAGVHGLDVQIPKVGAVYWSGSTMVRVRLLPSWRKRVTGLCGNFDLDGTNDVAVAALNDHWRVDGVAIPSLFPGDEWRVCKDEDPTAGHPCGDDPRAPASVAAQAYCAALNPASGDNSYGRCLQAMDATLRQRLYEACLHDHCAGLAPCDSFHTLEQICTRMQQPFTSVIDECGQCFGDGRSCRGICQAYGDPHFQSLDGHRYDFQGQCWYTLVRDCGLQLLRRPFEVQVRHSRWLPNRAVSVVEAVAVYIPAAQATVELYRNPAANRVNNGPEPALPYTFPNGAATISAGPSNAAERTIDIADVATIWWSGSSVVRVSLSPRFRGRTCGLCGDWDGDATDDAAHVARNDYWLLTDNNVLFTDGARAQCRDVGTVEPVPCEPGTPEYDRAKRYCRNLNPESGFYGVCYQAVDATQYLRDCMHDVCATEGACDVFVAYEQACREAGVRSVPSVVDECGVCFGDGLSCASAVCYAVGDPHYYTFDQQRYDWQGQCEYQLVGQCNIKAPVEQLFEVQVRNSDWLNPNVHVSVTEAVAIRVPGQGVLELHRLWGQNRWRGAQLPALPLTILDGVGNVVAVVTNPNPARPTDIEVRLPGLALVRWDGWSMVTVRVPAALNGTGLCGLCGNYDDNLGNELAHVALNDHWYESAVNSLFAQPKRCSDAGINPQHPCGADTSTPQYKAAEQYCRALLDADRYGACHDLVDPKPFYAQCIFDHCALDAACDTFVQYEDRCRAQGVQLEKSVVDECGVCFGDGTSCGAHCMASGDPHFWTFDTFRYDWQGACVYQLVRDYQSRAPEPFIFQVQVQLDRHPTVPVSTTEAVAVRVPGQGIAVLTRSLVTNTFNGLPLVTPVTLPDGTTITHAPGNPKDITVRIPGIGWVRYDGWHVVQVQLSARWRNRVCGLCGDYNLLAGNDAVHVAHGGDYWAVPAPASFFPNTDPQCVDDNAPTRHPCDLAGPDVARRARAFCEDLLSERYAECAKLVDPAPFVQDCMYDYCADPDTGCAMVAQFEQRCRALGFELDYVVDSCGVCHGDDDCGATCASYGDPHFRTWDNVYYDFQGTCEYVLAATPDGFMVQARHQGLTNRPVSINVGVAIRVPLPSGATARLELFANSANNLLNGNPLGPLPLTLEGTVVVSMPNTARPHDVEVKAKGFGKVTWGGSRIEVTLPPKYQGRVRGLCGNYDGRGDNDAAVVVLHDHWRVDDDTIPALFTDSASSTCQNPAEPPANPCEQADARTVAAAKAYCAALADPNGPYARCLPLVNGRELFNACMYDYCGSGAPAACEAIQTLEALCTRVGAAFKPQVDRCGVCFGDNSACPVADAEVFVDARDNLHLQPALPAGVVKVSTAMLYVGDTNVMDQVGVARAKLQHLWDRIDAINAGETPATTTQSPLITKPTPVPECTTCTGSLAVDDAGNLVIEPGSSSSRVVLHAAELWVGRIAVLASIDRLLQQIDSLWALLDKSTSTAAPPVEPTEQPILCKAGSFPETDADGSVRCVPLAGMVHLDEFGTLHVRPGSPAHAVIAHGPAFMAGQDDLMAALADLLASLQKAAEAIDAMAPRRR